MQNRLELQRNECGVIPEEILLGANKIFEWHCADKPKRLRSKYLEKFKEVNFKSEIRR